MSLNSDLSTITTIPVSALNRLTQKSQLCILHKVFENERKGSALTSVDIGIGTLYIKHESNSLQYKFIPSKSFEKGLKNTVNSKTSPLTEEVELALKERIMSAYKDLF